MRPLLMIALRMSIIVMLFAVGSAHAAEPVAMVTDLTGAAWLQGTVKDEKLSVLSYLEQGTSIRLVSNATITITTFSPPMEYVAIGPARVELRGGAVHLLGDGKLQRHDLQERKTNAARRFAEVNRDRLTMASVAMKSFDQGLKLIAPVNAELLNVRPAFRWSAPQDVRSFVLVLFDESEKRQISEVMVNEPHWKLPENIALLHEHQYSWQVRSVNSVGSEMTLTGKFSVIDEVRSKRILQLKPSANAPFSERVLYAVFLESEGLKLDAVDAWALLSAERPNEALLKKYAR